jgi:serine/threonine protein kinase
MRGRASVALAEMLPSLISMFMCRNYKLSPMAGTLVEVIQNVMYQFTTKDGQKVNVRVYSPRERETPLERHFYDSYKDIIPNVVPLLAISPDMVAFKSWESTILISDLPGLKMQKMSLDEVLTALSDLGQAIITLHGNGIVHGSLSPRNIVVDTVVDTKQFLMTYFCKSVAFNTQYPFTSSADLGFRQNVSDG